MAIDANDIIKRARVLASVDSSALDYNTHGFLVQDAINDLRTKRPELQLDSDGDALTATVSIRKPDDEVGVPDRFAHILAVFVAMNYLHESDRGVGKDRNKALDLMREYETKVYTT